MKKLFSNSKFLGLLITASNALVTILMAILLALNLKAPFETNDFWALSRHISDGETLNIFAFAVVILFYISLIPQIISIIQIFRSKQQAMVASVLSLLVIIVTLVVFQVINNLLSIGSLVLLVVETIFMLVSTVFLILRKKHIHKVEVSETTELSDKKVDFGVLVVDILSILVFLTLFGIPMYSRFDSAPAYHAILIRALFGGDTNIDVIIGFLAYFSILLGLLLYFAQVISYYFFDRSHFIQKSKTFIYAVFTTTFLFFLVGLGLTVYYTLNQVNTSSYALIPVLGMVLINFIFAILKGKFHIDHPLEPKPIKIRYVKSEPLLYLLLITAITAALLFVPIVVMKVTFGSFEYNVNLTGIKILTDYASLDPGYRLVAFVLVVMLLASGFSLVVVITSYLSNDKSFNSLLKTAVGINMFFIFIISVSGYYFQIGQEINTAVIHEIFTFYGITLPEGMEYQYSIGTDAIYALIFATLVLIIMFVRKSFNHVPLEVQSISSESESDSQSNGSSVVEGESLDNEYQPFDPCPAFTDLDIRIDHFKADLALRETYRTNNTSLNQLVHFVVEYAKNSRLHLSYTPEDIATFVAGMGAAKLSILQGMSGTGKTSLPKIFAEAVFGNCEIIEVESSWKDKNELLGYYNEFSMKYTPKKFTLALYKAALNKDIFTFILLDEMNLSRIEYYFSDFLSLMEHEPHLREIKLINIQLARKEGEEMINYEALEQGNTLKVPENVWFIGTANRDESTFVISDKVYDRAHTMNFTKRAPKVRNYTDPIDKQYYDFRTIQNLFDEAKASGNFDAENSELIKAVEILLAPLNISFGNRILKQIEDFVNIYKACFKDEDVEAEAIEKILLSKVVSKLETKTIDDKESLVDAFIKLKLNHCAAFVRRLDND
ncbi:hypothetical protein N7603_08355 [Acholeplasma vituli]|uniref:ATPase dynein-related AAA domain-containing protein n=1 Tax=Paracholeplasma vituli TaxID=69473 RepID=A0ABT2PXI5_9MOLU|nr:hypothetical protein [Paracholeplasma vituli]MCU0105669.1 hypothetical protein [Paracholeplasma vituli]